MREPVALARAYGVAVEVANLGDWGGVALIAEYDPAGPTIRVDARVQGHAAFAHAVAHELYHHREAIGEVRRVRGRAAREAAADSYADALVRAARA